VTKLLFISDLHIKDMQEEKAQILLRFLISIQSQASVTNLFLVGDIFDLWLGSHKYFIKKFRPIIDELKKFLAAGGKVHYFEGNHDLHLNHFYEWGLGCQVYNQASVFTFDNHVIRVEHGDQMDPEDKGYLRLRWFLRTDFSKALILNLPGMAVAKIGDIASKTSRNYTDNKRDPERILNVIHEHARKMHKLSAFDTLVSGHVHIRDEYQFQDNGKNITSYNLGCWDDRPIALQFTLGKWTWVELK
jgi:UDP-2,3-diacylglucosamine hydrolase